VIFKINRTKFEMILNLSYKIVNKKCSEIILHYFKKSEYGK